MSKTIIMSLGGSLITPDKIDIDFLKNFRKLILNYTRKNNRIILVCGGGNTARTYQTVARKINPKVKPIDLDWIGIAATKINAELISAIFEDKAKESIILDPKKKSKSNKKILVGSGYIPGCSSDKQAVLLAKTYFANTIINLSNIDYVYNKDPQKYRDAKPQKEISWTNFKKLVGNKWVPGAHLPFDPVATKLAANNKMKLIVINGNNLENLKKMLNDKNFIGTIVK